MMPMTGNSNSLTASVEQESWSCGRSDGDDATPGSLAANSVHVRCDRGALRQVHRGEWRVEKSNFDTHQLLRINETPAIEVYVGKSSALASQARVPDLDAAGFARFVDEAKKNCALSNAFNATITLDAKLIA